MMTLHDPDERLREYEASERRRVLRDELAQRDLEDARVRDGGGDGPDPSKGWQLKLALWLLAVLGAAVLYLGGEYIKGWRSGDAARVAAAEVRVTALEAEVRLLAGRLAHAEWKLSVADTDQKKTLAEMERIHAGLQRVLDEAL